MLRHIQYGVRESGFLLLAGSALYLIVALLSFHGDDPAWTHTGTGAATRNLGGVTGAWFSDIFLFFFGYLAYLFPLGIAFCGWRLFKRGTLIELDAEIVIFRSLGFAVALGAGCGLASLHLAPIPGSGSAGGVLGDFAGQALVNAFSFFGGNLFLLALLLAGVNLGSGVSWLAVMDFIGMLILGLARSTAKFIATVWNWAFQDFRFARESKSTDSAKSTQDNHPPAPAEKPPEAASSLDLKALEPPPDARRAKRVEPVITGAVENAPVEPFRMPEPTRLDSPAMPQPPTPKPDRPGKSADQPLPPLALLDRVPTEKVGYSDEMLEAISRQLETLLQHYGVEVKVVRVEPGPVITRFELAPAPGVKVNQISNLAKDLARGLSVISVRIVEVVPGKSVVGLEIPNQLRQTVHLSEILDSPAYAKSSSPLTLTLGKDIGGNAAVANLAAMPHLLVAGTTGSGKSVAINAMLLSMLYKATPREVRLILIDPKMLELSIYENIPHLLAPVVTDMKEAANALRWCVGEMERRYRLMAALKVRNIGGFNRVVAEAIEAGEPIPDPLFMPGDSGLGEPVGGEHAPSLEPLPFIVVVIDELADMMMIVGKKVEELIARLAQKARASGIHLILATQRPSVDIITGLIKANIPSRIAFQVSSKVDSRTILDQMGAEQLLGHGDMLFLPPGTGFPQRLHGAFVADHEVAQVVEHLKQSGEPEYLDQILEESAEAFEGFAGELPDATRAGAGEGDPLYDQAVRIVTESRKASISGVQRRLKIGYNRAARMIEEMEAAGIVGPLESNGNREVLAPPPPED